MRRERLKDQIEDPRVSVFDSFVRSVVVLISIGAVYYALSGRGFSFAPKTAPAPASVPSTAASQAISEVTLTATRNHTCYWNNEGPLPQSEVASRLAAWRKTVSNPRVVVAADGTATFGDTVYLLEEARRAGITRVHVEGRTRPSSQPPGS